MADTHQRHLLAMGPGHDAACGLCSDMATEAEVLAILDAGAAARVRADGCELEIATELVGPVRPGDRLLVHLGFAIARLEEP